MLYDIKIFWGIFPLHLQTTFNIPRCMALSLSNRPHKREDEQWEWKAAALRGRLPSSPLLGEKEEGGE